MTSSGKAKVGIIGGSGFYKMESLEDKVETPVETPWGPASSVPVSGVISGVEVVVIARHGHGHTVAPGDINYRANIWALKQLGVTHVLAATACGSLKVRLLWFLISMIELFVGRNTTRHVCRPRLIHRPHYRETSELPRWVRSSWGVSCTHGASILSQDQEHCHLRVWEAGVSSPCNWHCYHNPGT